MGKYALDLEQLLALGKILARSPQPQGTVPASVFLARSLLKIRDRAGQEQALHANLAQLRFEQTRGQGNIVLKARQMGISTWIAGRLFLKTITARGVLTVQVAQTREAAEGIFRIVQRYWECLPEELRSGCLRRNRANVGQMAFGKLDSEFRVVSASDTNAGRGLTIQNLHCSELARWPGDASETLAGLRAALSPDGELVMESTPNGAYGCFYEEWQQAQAKGIVRHFYPWWIEKSYATTQASRIRDEEFRLVHNLGLKAGQIGFRRTLEAEYRRLFSQEFAEDAERCFRATGECCFDIEIIEGRLAAVPDPIERRRHGALEIWLPPVPGKEYIVAVDPAGGGADGDFSAIEVIEVSSGLQCAELRQRIGGLQLAREIAALAREYRDFSGQGALVVVERNNHGSGVLAYLNTVEHYPWMYEQAGAMGWLTTAGSKPGLVSRMGALLTESPWLFLSKRLLEECRTFITYAGGRTGAANGTHDDCLMAMGIAQAVRAERLQTGRAA
jgi:hypothetical protein